MLGTSVTRLGDFWKFFVTNFLSKVAKILSNFLGLFWKHISKQKLHWPFLRTNLLKKLATLYSNIWSHCSAQTSGIFCILFFTPRCRCQAAASTTPSHKFGPRRLASNLIPTFNLRFNISMFLHPTTTTTFTSVGFHHEQHFDNTMLYITQILMIIPDSDHPS